MKRTLRDYAILDLKNEIFIDSKGKFYLAYFQPRNQGVRIIPLSKQGADWSYAEGIAMGDFGKYKESSVKEAKKKIKNLQTNVSSWKKSIDSIKGVGGPSILSENKPFTNAIDWLHEQLSKN